MCEIPVVEGIDVRKTLSNLGVSVDAYRDMLGDFAREGLSKIELIKEKAVLPDLSDFVILVHGAKGSSRLIGLDSLADEMYALELAGKGSDRDYISVNLDRVLSLYEGFAKKLKPFDTRFIGQKRKDIDSDELQEMLIKLNNYLEDFESEEAEKLVKKMNGFNMTKAQENIFIKLLKAIDNFDYFTSLECVKEMMEVSEV